MRAWDAEIAARLRKAGTGWDKIGQVFGVTGDTVKVRIDPEYAQKRKDRNNQRRRAISEGNSVLKFKERRLQECREMSASKKASGFRYNEGARATQAEDGWRRQVEVMPRDTRSATGFLMGDPIIGDSRCPWRPSSQVRAGQ